MCELGAFTLNRHLPAFVTMRYGLAVSQIIDDVNRFSDHSRLDVQQMETICKMHSPFCDF